MTYFTRASLLEPAWNSLPDQGYSDAENTFTLTHFNAQQTTQLTHSNVELRLSYLRTDGIVLSSDHERDINN